MHRSISQDYELVLTRPRASYSLHHERGQKRLAKQVPFWVVLFKALAAALFTVILEWHLFFLYPAIVLLPIAVFLLIFLYFHHLREHPTASQYYDHEFVRFADPDRKSTRLNSSHLVISYAVFCLKKTNRPETEQPVATATMAVGTG